MEAISNQLLSACSIYLGKNENWLPEMASKGNTIMRIIHYPPLDSATPEGAVRSAAHEDINFITLLMTATAAGLQVMDHDGTWIDVEGNHEQIIVDSGDMIQNLTNGLFKSTTHRVVNPEIQHNDDSLCQCLFIHEMKLILLRVLNTSNRPVVQQIFLRSQQANIFINALLKLVWLRSMRIDCDAHSEIARKKARWACTRAE